MKTPEPDNKNPVLMCKGCHEPRRHTFRRAFKKKVGKMRGELADDMIVFLYACTVCLDERIWGSENSAPSDPKKSVSESVEDLDTDFDPTVPDGARAANLSAQLSEPGTDPSSPPPLHTEEKLPS